MFQKEVSTTSAGGGGVRRRLMAGGRGSNEGMVAKNLRKISAHAYMSVLQRAQRRRSSIAAKVLPPSEVSGAGRGCRRPLGEHGRIFFGDAPSFF